MSDYNVLVEWQHSTDEQMAKDVANTLTSAYPGHPWHVNITGGCIVLKHMRISDKWGMTLHYMRVNGDAKRLRQGVLVAGGELLERAGMLRGSYDGTPIQKVDGIPTKDLRLT